MEPTPSLLKQLRRKEIEDARQQTLAQKFWAGAELFDYACEAAKTGIRMQHPDFSEEQVLDELRRRIELAQCWRPAMNAVDAVTRVEATGPGW